MSNSINFFVLISFAAIQVAMGIKCYDKPFEEYIEACVGQNPDAVHRTVCQYTNAGVISEDLEFNVARFKELVQPHIVEGREDLAKEHFDALQVCVDEGLVGHSGYDILDSLRICPEFRDTRLQLLKALCKD